MMNTYLNTENIARSKGGVEYHPLHPFLPENAKVLFLGSFPPQRKRWCMDFYYPNFINDHWRIEGQIFFGDKNHFVDLEAKRFKIDEIIAFCQEKGLAFFDTSRQLPHLRAIVTTGEKATETICTSLGIPTIPKVNTFVTTPLAIRRGVGGEALLLYRLPSSSRAYPLSFDKKVEAYRQVLNLLL